MKEFVGSVKVDVGKSKVEYDKETIIVGKDSWLGYVIKHYDTACDIGKIDEANGIINEALDKLIALLDE
jgi:hypothetical protein